MLLFDLEKDPVENNNLSGEYPKIYKRLILQYERFLHSLPKKF